MDHPDDVLTALGGLLLVALIVSTLAPRFGIPRTPLLLLAGFVAGRHGLGLLPEELESWFPALADVAVAIVALLAGSRLVHPFGTARQVHHLVISGTIVVVTAPLVTLALLSAGTGVDEAILLGTLSIATALTSTAAVVEGTGAHGPFTAALVDTTAIDDAITTVLFALALVVLEIADGAGSTASAIGSGAWTIGGSVAIGALVGVVMALESRWIEGRGPSLLEMLAAVTLAAGVAVGAGLSLLLLALAAGTTATIVCRNRPRPLAALNAIEWPVLALFFMLSGLRLDPSGLRAAGLTGLVYLLVRPVGIIGGGWLGAVIGRGPRATARWIGLALLPQSGVVLGLAFFAASELPGVGREVLAVVAVISVLFDVVGPFLTRASIIRAGEAHGLGTES